MNRKTQTTPKAPEIPWIKRTLSPEYPRPACLLVIVDVWRWGTYVDSRSVVIVDIHIEIREPTESWPEPNIHRWFDVNLVES
jgi:hypothetical protein